MTIFKQIKRAYYLTGKSYLFLIHNISLIIYPILAILLYAFLEFVFLVFLYWRYGIHFFNEHTLERWGLISFWDISLFTLIICAPLYIFYAVSILYVKLAVAHSIKHVTTNEKPHILESLFLSFKRIPQMFKFARISMILHFLYDPAIMRYSRHAVKNLGGKTFIDDVRFDTWIEKTFLVIPVIGFEKTDLKDAIDTSDSLMETTFGHGVIPKFSFTAMMIVTMIVGALIAERLTNYLINPVAGFAMFFFVLGLVICLVRIGEGIFQTATYQFCKKEPSGYFEPSDFTSSFTSAQDQL